MAFLEQIHHIVQGPEEGPRLVFLHGLLGSAANWRSIVGAFEGQFRILTFDQRGHGKSFQPEQGYTPEDFAEDLRKILDELGWQKVHLVGHSMGGRNAIRFASQYPDRVARLVIEDIGPEPNPQAALKTQSMIEMVPTPFESKKLARDYFKNEFAKNLGGGAQAEVLAQYFYTNIKVLANGQADWRFLKSGVLAALNQGHGQDRWQEWNSLTVPTLVVRGEKSAELTAEVFNKMVAAGAHIEGVEVAQAGHWVHFDQVQEFIRVLQKFLNPEGF